MANIHSYDFFNCMNIGQGKTWTWFWKIWFFDQGYPDFGIASPVNPAKNELIVTSKGSKPVPVDVTVYFNDNYHGTKYTTSVAVLGKRC